MRYEWLCVVLMTASMLSAAQVARRDSNGSELQDAARDIAAGKLADAENKLQPVLDSTPREYRARDLLGVVRVLQHREPEAEECFRRVIREKPDFSPAHAHLGLLYLQMSRSEEAVPQLREAISLDSARSDASYALVCIF